MFARKVSDLHMHLNGSFSMEFLEATAKKNQATDSYAQLVKVRQDYAKLGIPQNEGEQKLWAELVWKIFSLIQKIVQTLEDICAGTLDVIAKCKAPYLEIRTSAKVYGQASWGQYVDVFVAGLIEGNAKLAGKKIARGMLSLDRTVHTPEVAIQIIDRVVSEKLRTGMLVGIDLSGFFLSKRTLTGEGLAQVLRYALAQDIGLGIHLGETPIEMEKSEVDVILTTLEDWAKTQKATGKNPFEGKVRLGHAIFLTPEQSAKIKAMQLPVEICPSGHQQSNWWPTNQPHPITAIYNSWKDPVVSGTDDEIIFGGDAKQENEKVLAFLGYPENQSKGDVRAHQSKFRFGGGVVAAKGSNSSVEEEVSKSQLTCC